MPTVQGLDENQGKNGQGCLRTGGAGGHWSQGKEASHRRPVGNVKHQSGLRRVKMQGRSSNVVTQRSLGGLWKNNLGEGRGKTQQRGVCVLKVKTERADLQALPPKPALFVCQAPLCLLYSTFTRPFSSGFLSGLSYSHCLLSQWDGISCQQQF